eukprot:SAG11_NODE_15867_length_564_cov_0.660215_2_plen_39_part_01
MFGPGMAQDLRQAWVTKTILGFRRPNDPGMGVGSVLRPL